MFDSGRRHTSSARSSLFAIPVVGWLLKKSGQIPVYRNSAAATDAYRAAVDGRARRQGARHLPRGHHHPRPRPVADARQDRCRPRRARDPLPAHPGGAVGRAGDPVPLRPPALALPAQDDDDVRRPARRPRPTSTAARSTPKVLREATDRLMDRITDLLEVLRGEKRPTERFDPRTHGVPEIGEPLEARGDRAHRAIEDADGNRVTRVAVLGSGNWGTAFADDPGRRRLRRDACGPAAGRSPTPINAGRNDAYLPELELPDGGPRHGATRRGARRRRRRRARRAVADAAGQPDAAGAARSPRARRSSP